MFQNIQEGTIEQNEKTNEFRKLNIVSNLFNKKDLLIYIVSFMVSTIGLAQEVSPFSISMIGACFSSSIPALGVIIISLIGNIIKFGINGALSYILTVLVLVATLFIIKPRYNEENRNEKIKIGKNIFISTFLIQLISILVSGYTIYDLLTAISVSIITVVFYKIFVNSLVALQAWREKRAFSIEEVIGASLLLSIAVSCFGDFAIFGFSIRNILSILIVLILGWKNGILIGTTSGVTIGVTLGVITNTEPTMVAAYAISGMIAGILNRFGKIGVIVGFCLGNVVLAYVSNGMTVELIHFKEILIASIGLLAVPKNINIDIEDFVKNSKFLPVFPSRSLNRSQETIDKLNNVSEAIQNIADTYKEEELDIEEKSRREKNKQIFISELLDRIEYMKENLLYDDISNVDGEIVDKIFSELMDKQEITRKELLKIFAECNSYIVGFDDKDVSKYLEDNITQMLKAINDSYQISKSNFVWMKKIEENKKNIKSQLNGVSKVISDIAEDMEKEIIEPETFVKQKQQIIELLKQKKIEVQDVSIKKEENERFFVDIYLKEDGEEIQKTKIEQIVTQILGESIVVNEENSIGKKISLLSEDKFLMAIGTSSRTKADSKESGDSVLNVKLKDGKYLIAISDGMGSGKEAKTSSATALKILESLSLSGLDKSTAIDLITSSLINQNEEIFATLDIAIIDLYKGNVEFIKKGACPTYIKNKKRVQVIKSNSLPAGMINKSSLQVFDKDISSGEILFMCSDGILDSNIEYKNKELWIKYMLEDIETNNTQKITDLILNEAIDNNFGVAKDDMTAIACKFIEK